jgi:predicted ATPase/class 3 adenylate cyclase
VPGRLPERTATVSLSALPTGAVVFLFSDIEGSTRRWESYAEAMRDAVRRHDEIVRSEIECRRGHVFKTIGDAFCATFWTVGEALQTAVAVQQRLGSEDFASVDGLRVRIAIHAGETDERGGDYFGPAVNRTARLLSTGHGGQVLVSGLARDLAAANPPSGIVLRHLGTLPLRDLAEPERVYQAVAPGLASEFKPLRLLETPPNNLPRQTTNFVGRDEDLADVEALLQDASLVTVVGAGGIGKTRLALEAAASRLNDFSDGAWLVDLSRISDAALLASAVLSVLGGEQSGDIPPLDALLRRLEKRELLLVLDNCEHVVAEAARIAAAVLERCPHVVLLATSREALDVSGERIHRLPTLDPQSAARLFIERAQAADRAFDAGTSLAIVQDICRRLDGIALAIELAAARTRTMSIESLSRHLELRMLAGGRDRRPRQQTMQALIDWSYDLLIGEERAALRRCSIFVGGFSLRAATAVCDLEAAGEWRGLELLSSLVDKSLLVLDAQHEEQRYRLLEPIRQYALEKLDRCDEMQVVARRHAQAFASLAGDAYTEWENGPNPNWLTRLEMDLPNFRAALRWTIEKAHDLRLGAQTVEGLAPVFLRLTLLAEGIEWCERILGAELTLPAAEEARLRYGLSMLYNNQGANHASIVEAFAAVALYRDAGDRRGLAQALSQVAQHHARALRYDEARVAAEEALQLARESQDPLLLATSLRRCAEAFTADGMDGVRARYAESVALFRQFGAEEETARALTWWGQSEAEAGDYASATARFLEARRLAGHDLSMHLAIDIAACYLSLGDHPSAEPLARQALALAAQVHHPTHLPTAIVYIAASARGIEASEAARLLGYAEERLRLARWQSNAPDRAIIEELKNVLRRELAQSTIAELLAEGARWSESEAVSRASGQSPDARLPPARSNTSA